MTDPTGLTSFDGCWTDSVRSNPIIDASFWNGTNPCGIDDGGGGGNGGFGGAIDDIPCSWDNPCPFDGELYFCGPCQPQLSAFATGVFSLLGDTDDNIFQIDIASVLTGAAPWIWEGLLGGANVAYDFALANPLVTLGVTELIEGVLSPVPGPFNLWGLLGNVIAGFQNIINSMSNTIDALPSAPSDGDPATTDPATSDPQ